jgi:hypothetical protein
MGNNMIYDEPNSVLMKANECVSQGEYEEALNHYIWYHERAHIYDPSLVGVQLSFALHGWVQLGEKYPPAREALLALRERMVDAVKAGESILSSFQVYAAINRECGEVSKTGELFLIASERQSKDLRQCYLLAEDGLVAIEAFHVCSLYINSISERYDAIRRVRALSLDHNRTPMKLGLGHGARYRESVESRFANEVSRVIMILLNVGRTEEAEQLCLRALADCDNDNARTTIMRHRFGLTGN